MAYPAAVPPRGDCSIRCWEISFFEMVCQPCFVSQGSQPSLVQANHELFQGAGPKGHFFAVGTDADFTERMDGSQGTLFWLSDESISCLDTDFMSGVSRSKDASKVDIQSILSCQNGGAFGPKSLKSQVLSILTSYDKGAFPKQKFESRTTCASGSWPMCSLKLLQGQNEFDLRPALVRCIVAAHLYTYTHTYNLHILYLNLHIITIINK